MGASNGKLFFAAVIAAFFLIFAAGMLSFFALPSLVLFDNEGRKLAELPLGQEGFIHRYIHSIHMTPVDEEYVVAGKALELVRLRYDSYGVGMPSDGGEAFRIENNRFVVDMRRTFTRLDIMVSHLPGHGLSIDGKFYPFIEWVPAESMITLKAGKKILIFSRRKAHP